MSMPPPAAPPAYGPPGAPPGYGPPPMPPKRPIGVTILAVLGILFGIIALFGGIVLLGAAALIAAVAPQYAGYAGLFVALGAIVLLTGILAIVASVGLLRLRMWAWWLMIIVAVLQIVSGIAQFALAPGVFGVPYGAVLWLIIVIYLIVVRKSFSSARPAGM